VKAEDICKVVVVGTGAMGEGIAQNFAQAGLSVLITDIDNGAAERCLAQIDSSLALFRELDLLKEDASLIKSRIAPFPMERLTEVIQKCDLLVEAIPEDLDLKRSLFSQIDISSQDIILCSNTGSFTISSISEGLLYPGRVVGLHYFYPAHIIPLVEIHRGSETDDRAIEVVRDLMYRIGKKPIMVMKEIPGFIVNRIQAALSREISYLVDEGVTTPEDLDVAAKASYGFRLACFGPFEIQDMNGLDSILKARNIIVKSLCNSTAPSDVLVKKVEAKELGVKSGRGWYDYKGMSREEIRGKTNRKLLQQLILYYSREKTENQRK